MKFALLLIGVASVLWGCSTSTPQSKSSPPAPSSATTSASSPAFHFRDIQDEAGVKFTHTDGSCGRHFFIEQIGAGVALIDYDNDGLLDIFAVNGAPLPGYKGDPNPRSALYHNLGGGKFEDVSVKAGVALAAYGHGVCAGDYDNDGWIDLYVTCTGENRLFRNRGNGTFEEVAKAAGVAADQGIHTSAAFFDYDNDGRLDLYVCGYVTWSVAEDRWCNGQSTKKRYCGPEVYTPHQDRLFHNIGNGRFEDVSAKTGVVVARAKSLGVVSADVNDDGWPDLYVANDLEPNLLFVNQNGRFKEEGVSAGVAFSGDGASEAGMGVIAGDYDNDCRLDLFVTNYSFEMYGLYKNQGAGAFTYESDSSGIGPPTLIPLGFGTRFADFDNDGWQDLVTANGHVLDDIAETNQALEYAQTMQIFRNQQGHFDELTRSAGPAFERKFIGRGLAVGDIDNDGQVDIVVNNCKGPLRVIRNEQKTGNWVTLQLEGRSANRSAIGARVTLETDTGKQCQEVISGASFLSHSDLRLHFGLGTTMSSVTATVRWPGSGGKPGPIETFRNLSVNRLHQLVQGSSAKGGNTHP